MKLNSNAERSDVFVKLRRNLAKWGIPTEFIDEIRERSLAVNFEKDVVVLGRGSANDLFGCVLSGIVKVYCVAADGNRTLLRLAGPSELIGYADYIDDKNRHAQLFETRSAGKCRVALINRERVARLLGSLSPESLIHILQAINTFWSQDLQWSARLLNLPLSQRLEVVLNELAQRFGVKDDCATLLIPDLAQEDLAEMIGCSRPMVSRLLAEMAQRGLVSRSGKQYRLLNNWNFGDTRNQGQTWR